MTDPQSAPTDVLERLQAVIDLSGPLRRQQFTRYDRGHVLEVEATGVCPALTARARLVVEKFIGGGFAGQVYRVRLDALDAPDGDPEGLQIGRTYAVKILVPPSRFSLAFRGLVFGLAYQGPFAPQVCPAAARTGVLWQKLIRGAATIEFGRPDAVCDTYATFYDEGLGAWGEINEWVDGRNWTFELDEHLFERTTADPDDPSPDFSATGAPEYFAKKHFMARFVRLLHRIGAGELARQYEWWTAKSQPNVLKRLDAGAGPADGLCAIDFRAGLALLPFLPMSPADVKLIATGLARGALVQFDRGDLGKLESYSHEHADRFADLRPALDELREADPAYRRSLIDITHHGPRLLWNGAHRKAVADGFVHHWRAKHLLDNEHASRLRGSGLVFSIFMLASLIPFVLGVALVVGAVPLARWLFERWGLLPDGSWPLVLVASIGVALAVLVVLRLLGALFRCLRRLWGHARYRQHVAAMLRSPAYLVRSLHARQAEMLMDWHRTGRRGPEAVVGLATSAWRFWPQKWVLGRLPARWHRFLIEPLAFAWPAIKRTVGGAILFIRDAEFRQHWLENVIDEGHRQNVLSDAEHAALRPKAADPYIRTYLLCLAGHFATLPVTQIVSVIVAIWAWFHMGKTWEESVAYAAGILVAFQVVPISPGSFCRGLIAVGVMIRKRNFRDFRVAAAISFWKYIGYLGFPIQMATKYPILARLMAGRWASGAVRFVPVFGEHGALLEHGVLDLCFNEPVSIRQRIAEGRETTAKLVTKVLLAAAWFGLTVAAAILSWRARGADDGTLDAWSLLPLWIVTGLALLSVLTWTVMAPRFARIRRFWWALALASLVPAAATLLMLHRT